MKQTVHKQRLAWAAAILSVVAFLGGCRRTAEEPSKPQPGQESPTRQSDAQAPAPEKPDDTPAPPETTEKPETPPDQAPEQPDQPDQPEPETKPETPAPDDEQKVEMDLPEGLEKVRLLTEEEKAEAEAKRLKEHIEEMKKAIAAMGPPLVDNPDKLVRLNPINPVWIDPVGKRVVMVGQVCQRAAPLEMFACLWQTKEHEAVVTVPTKAQDVHAGLLAIGAKAGKPVQFRPEYIPASGTEIEVTVVWKDEKGQLQKARAQDWIRNMETGKAMKYPWVFAGSGF